MKILQPKYRIWLDLTVATTLLSLLGFGSVYIYHLNNDARELRLTSEQAMRGQQISTNSGCIACHTIDGSPGVGPSWLNMWGRSETLSDGTIVKVDAEYFKKSLLNPSAQVVQGYPNVMLRYFLDDNEIADLITFARTLSTHDQSPEAE